MKILHLSSSDINGGAAISAYRLHKDLKNAGIKSKMLVLEKKSSDDDIISLWQNKKRRFYSSLVNKIEGNICKKFLPPKIMFSLAWFPGFILKKIKKLNPDIVNLHWINNGLINISEIGKIQQPIVWTMHDLWPSSIGYHYLFDMLNKWHKDGKPLNQSEYGKNSITRNIQKRKINAFSKKNITFVAPSKWLQKAAQHSFIGKNKQVYNFPYSVPIEIFKPADKKFARQRFNLPNDKKIILFGSEFSDTDSRKGVDLLLQSLEKQKKHWKNKKPVLAIFGNSSENPSIKAEGYKNIFLGKFHDWQTLSLLYAASDCFVCPSREDNLPNTVLEALACGIPCAAFKIGGMPDMIQHKKNGFLAKDFDTNALGEGINWILENLNDKKSREICRNSVLDKFNSKNQVENYLKLYKNLYG